MICVGLALWDKEPEDVSTDGTIGRSDGVYCVHLYFGLSYMLGWDCLPGIDAQRGCCVTVWTH